MTRDFQIIRLRANGHSISAENTALAIGNFDGVHAGHQAVMQQMLQAARSQNLTPSVLTFAPHPRAYFARTQAPFLLQPFAARLRTLRDLGVARIFVLWFDHAMAHLSAQDFCDQILTTRCRAQAVMTGENFHFGYQRKGDAAFLSRWAKAAGREFHAVSALHIHGDICSSTRIRTALRAGDVTLASRLLTRPHRLEGCVLHGDKRGRTLGFPTANIALMPHCITPAYGVYALRATLPDDTRFEGVGNLGLRPSIEGESAARLEAHLFDYQGDLYGRHLRVELMAFLRPERRFDTLQALTHQIAVDAGNAKDFFAAKDVI